MNYQEAMTYLEEIESYGSFFGLLGIKELLNRIGNPQKRLNIIHVAGTNGKGSTAAFISSILAEAGCRVGRYISPPIFDYREKIQVQDKTGSHYILKENVIRWTELLKSTAASMVSEGMNHPTIFEMETAMAFMEYAERRCDPVVLEVGLGGRLDATNIITAPLCAVITSIGLDHMQFLGDTLESIAYEKTGIIKAGCAAVSYGRRGSMVPTRIIRECCALQGADLKEVNWVQLDNIRYELEGTTFDYKNYKNLKIGLLGEFQPGNAAEAVEVAETLLEKGYRISENNIYDGLANAEWKGRFDIISEDPFVLADGGHNEEAVISLAKSIAIYLGGRSVLFVMGVFKDKDYRSILKQMLPCGDLLITVTPPQPRGLKSELLKKAAEEVSEELREENPGFHSIEVKDGHTVEEGLKMVMERTDKNTAVVVFGSLSILKAAYNFFESEVAKTCMK